jgi:hypothetical protein
MGLVRTIDLIVGSPIRSRIWKIVDVAFLSVLWTASIVCVVDGLAGGPFSMWYFAARLLVPVTMLATARSWYRHPGLSKRAKQKAVRRKALESVWVAPTEQPVRPD